MRYSRLIAYVHHEGCVYKMFALVDRVDDVEVEQFELNREARDSFNQTALDSLFDAVARLKRFTDV